MKLTLHTLQGEELFECNVDVSSSQDWSLMADNKLSITFQLEHCVNLSPGSYVDYDGVRFYLLKEVKPTEIDSATWSYNLTLFDAASWMSVTVPVNLLDGKNNPTFVYTASLREHAAIIVANLNRRMNTDQWKVGNIIDSSNITVKYDGRYCSAILQELVDDQNTEWWVDGMTLNIGRAEFGEAVELGYGNGLLGNIVCDQADNMRSYAYLYPLGSTRNIDPTKYGYERLQLPNGQMYVDMSETGIAELVEERAFAGIFPRYEGAVTSVRSRAATSGNGEEFIIYYISDSDIPFNPNNYKMPGLVPNITFLSGELMGQDFEVNYDADAHEFEIITRWTSDNATQLPGGLLTPAVGDEYVVWNITMPDEYYPKAEQEFLEAAQKYADKAEKDISIYKANLDYIEVQERGLQLRPGQKVRLISSEYFPDKGYYDSRITRITRKLWYPDEVTIDVSAVRVIGSLSRIESSLSKAETRVSQLSVSIPAIIKSTDNSLPTDSSVYTSLRIDKEYLSRRKGGVMEGPLYIENTLASASWTGNKGMAFRPLQDGSFRGDIDEFHTKELFTDTFYIAGIPFRKMANGSLFIDASVVFGGGVTMYGTDTTPAPSIFDGLPIDGRTIKRDGNGALYVDETALSVSGGGGGGVADSVVWANVYGKPTWITDTKPTYNYSEIQGAPDLSVYFLASNFTKANIKTTLGISDWALESAKPAYTAKEVGAVTESTTLHSASLNDFTTAGIYRFNIPADTAEGMTNYGNLFVIRGGARDTLSQLYFNSDGGGRIFVRSGSINNYTSRSWKTLAFTSDIPSLTGYATETFVNTALAGYLPLSGGTLTNALTVKGSGQPLTVHRTQSSASVVKFVNTDGTLGLLGVSVEKNAIFIEASGAIKKLLHSGNYSDYALPKDGTAASATKLATPRTIWGQSFDGTGNVSGRLDDVEFINFVGSWLQIGLERNESSAVQNIKIQSHGGKELLINPTGPNVAIGGTTASAKLHVYGNIKTSGFVIADTRMYSYGYLMTNTGLSYCGLVQNSLVSSVGDSRDIWLYNEYMTNICGRTGVSIDGASAGVTIKGNLLTTGGITMYSQRSLKNILSYDGLSLEQLSVIKPIKFTWRDGRDNRYHVGGVADDVETVVPEVVYSANDFLTMDYGNAGFYVAASLIKPVIYCYNKVEKHEQDIDYLKRENVAIKNENKALRDEINQLKQAS